MSDSDSKTNLYGDLLTPLAGGCGVDIASQRADDLDNLALGDIRTRGTAGTRVRALDVACGEGGQSVRMALAGAQVTACDIQPMGERIAESAHAAGAMPVAFVQADMRDLRKTLNGIAPAEFDILLCQRAIHYLHFDDAILALRELRSLAAPDARLYLSASGLDSELGQGYLARDRTLRGRFAPLDPVMAEKHHIHHSVTLYTEDGLATVAGLSGWNAVRIFRSAFGNIKGVFDVVRDGRRESA